jgi:hypothetical protein
MPATGPNFGSETEGVNCNVFGPIAPVKELMVIRVSVLTLALLAAFAPGIGRAQTNIDQGKSASQIFASACVDCHKAPRRLARGKNSWALTEFLSGHTQQAAIRLRR